jgi:hypothetical protein
VISVDCALPNDDPVQDHHSAAAHVQRPEMSRGEVSGYLGWLQQRGVGFVHHMLNWSTVSCALTAAICVLASLPISPADDEDMIISISDPGLEHEWIVKISLPRSSCK